MLESLERRWEELARRLEENGTADLIPDLVRDVEEVRLQLRRMCEASVTRTTLREAITDTLPVVLEQLDGFAGASSAGADAVDPDQVAVLANDLQEFRNRLQQMEQQQHDMAPENGAACDHEPVAELTERIRSLESTVEALTEKLDRVGNPAQPDGDEVLLDMDSAAAGPSLPRTPLTGLSVGGYDFRLGELESRFRSRLELLEESRKDERERLRSLRELLMGEAQALGNGASGLWQRVSGKSEQELKANLTRTLERTIGEIDGVLAAGSVPASLTQRSLAVPAADDNGVDDASANAMTGADNGVTEVASDNDPTL